MRTEGTESPPALLTRPTRRRATSASLAAHLSRLGLDYVPPTFASESEREEAYMKAVEGLLVCGVSGDGLNRPGHYLVRVDSGPNAGLYDLERFGYVTS